jgi:methionyl aminopeptidase
MKCPTCQKLGLPVAMASFCTQQCFKDNWSSHKALHKAMRGNKKATSTSSRPVDPLAYPIEFQNFQFTGDYRPAYVTPQRRCPSEIIGPDYSTHVQGEAASEIAARHQPPPERGPEELDILRKVCVLGREIVDVAGKAVAVGVTGDELDRIVHEATIERGGYPSPLNYYNFPKSVCVSPNEVICHGVPNCRPIKNGDIVNLDVTIYKHGMHADLNETFLVGDVSDEHVDLVKTAYKCLQVATNSVKVSCI